jgi:hypothetical protein
LVLSSYDGKEEANDHIHDPSPKIPLIANFQLVLLIYRLKCRFIDVERL